MSPCLVHHASCAHASCSHVLRSLSSCPSSACAFRSTPLEGGETVFPKAATKVSGPEWSECARQVSGHYCLPALMLLLYCGHATAILWVCYCLHDALVLLLEEGCTAVAHAGEGHVAHAGEGRVAHAGEGHACSCQVPAVHKHPYR